MTEDYYTVLEPFETESEIKKSRFISRVYHIDNEEDAEAIIASVKKEHYKATHVCSAWVLNTTPPRQKASDDGEPSGTAGKPILEVMLRKNITNILVVVIRYFGGVKLGASGLIRAYSGGAADVLSQCQVIKKQYSDILSIAIDYTSYGGLKNVLTSAAFVPVAEDFGEKVTLHFETEVAQTDDLIQLVRETTNDRFEYTLEEKRFIDLPVRLD